MAKNIKQEVADDPVIQEIRKSLTRESERVSSASTGLEQTISDAISGTRSAGESTEQRIDINFDRQRTEGLRSGQQGVTKFSENRGGFATNLAVLRNVVHETDKYLKDLESRRQEAHLANDAATASALSELMLKGEEMKLNAMQNSFNNLVQISNMSMTARHFQLGQEADDRRFDLTYELEGKKFQLQKDMQSSQEKQAMSNIALQFGLTIGETDTIDTMTTRAAATGHVSKRQALELEMMRSEINRANQQASEAMRGNKIRELDDLTKDMFAEAYRKGNGDILKAVENPNDLGDILKRASNQQEAEIGVVRGLIKEMSGDVNTAVDKILNDPRSFAIPKETLTQMVNEEFGARRAQEILRRYDESKSRIRNWQDMFTPSGLSGGREVWS